MFASSTPPGIYFLEDISNETSDKSSTPWDGSVCVCVGEGGRFLTSAN